MLRFEVVGPHFSDGWTSGFKFAIWSAKRLQFSFLTAGIPGPPKSAGSAFDSTASSGEIQGSPPKPPFQIRANTDVFRFDTYPLW